MNVAGNDGAGAGRIRIVLRNEMDNSNPVRLSDLLVFLERLSGALGTVDRAVNGRQSMFFDVSDLRYGSAIVEVRERVQENRRGKRHTLRSVVGSLEELIQGAENVVRPFWASPDVLKKVRKLGDPLPHTAQATLETPALSTKVDDSFRDRMDELLSPDSSSMGQLSGTLDAINMHGRRHAYIYPTIGHQKVVCDFTSQSDIEFKDALQRRVRITGELSRRSGDPFPYFVKADQIEVIPPDEELPNLRSLQGSLVPIFPGSSVDFQRQMRNG